MTDIEALEQVFHVNGGGYAEVGVYEGNNARVIAEHMPSHNALWLFDSFKGHGEPGPLDDAINHPKGRYAGNTQKQILDKVEPFLSPKHNSCFIIPGFVPETFQYVEDLAMFRFVRIDVDHYAPTKASIEFFLPRMVSGGIMEFDDFEASTCDGATAAVREIFGNEAARHWVKP